MKELIMTLEPVLVDTAVTLLVLALTWAVPKLTGVYLDEKAKKGIHEALENAAKAVLKQGGMSKEKRIEEMVDYVKQTNPGDIKRLGAEKVLERLAQTKL